MISDSAQSGLTNSDASKPSTPPAPLFCPWISPPETNIVRVQSNEVHLIPTKAGEFSRSFQVTAQETSNTASGGRLLDDIVIFNSKAGVVFARIPNALKLDEVSQWVESMLQYMSSSEEAKWWHTDHQGPWDCWVFVPMHAKRLAWHYAALPRDATRPCSIMGMLDTYAETKPWAIQSTSSEEKEWRVASINGICYLPHRKAKGTNNQNPDLKRSTRVRFMWNPENFSREIYLHDMTDRMGGLVNRVEMKLIDV